jgi:hypothetical protein
MLMPTRVHFNLVSDLMRVKKVIHGKAQRQKCSATVALIQVLALLISLV